jgi:MFS transporter, UMF1 family
MKNFPSIWRRDVLSWSLYDFANTIFSMNIVSLYVKLYIVKDLGYPDRYFDLTFAASMFVCLIFLPALGAMSDHVSSRKAFLFVFTVICCSSVFGMAFVPPSWIFGLLILFAIANFAYEAGLPFYNTLLYSVAEGLHARYVSGVGVAMGYVGSIAGMLIVLPFVSGSVMGLKIPGIDGSGSTGAYIPTAILFAIFAIPLFIFVREKKHRSDSRFNLRKAYREVWEGLRNTRKYPGVRRFLVADYFFEDAAVTIVLNIGFYCSVVLGFSDTSYTLFLVASTASAVIGSWFIGKLAERHSLKNMISTIVGAWIVTLILFVLVQDDVMIWVLGSVIGILLGGLWTTTRPFLAELVPHDELGRFYGIFSLSGRSAAVIGPVVWTGVVYLLNAENLLGQLVVSNLQLSPAEAAAMPYRVAIITIALLMAVGLFIFRKVPHTRKLGHV